MKKYYFLIFGVFLFFGLSVFFPANYEAWRIETAIPVQLHVKEEQIETSSKPSYMVLDIEEGQDIILSSYRDPVFREDVLTFFKNLTGSFSVAEAILSTASEMDISPALAFALCAEESGYNPRAFNRNRNDTVDRGLFQLNNASFPKLQDEDFYVLDINVHHGLSHLRWCLGTAGSEVAGLAMYNAGAGRVRSMGTPKSTLDYVARILKRQRKIEGHFIAEYVRIVEAKDEKAEKLEANEKTPLRFSLLTPLGGR